MNSTQRKQCPGSSRPAVEGTDPLTSVYPFCSVCGKEFSAQGRKHRYNQGNSWKAIPTHLVEVAK